MTFLEVKEPVQLRTVLVDPVVARREMFCLMLGDRDLQLTETFESVSSLLEAQPSCDLVMVCADAVNERVIADVQTLRGATWGVLVLLDATGPSDIETVIAAGADHVLPLRPAADRFSIAAHAAIAQARLRHSMEQACEQARRQLDDMKSVSRAKMILMARHAIGEDEAHRRVQEMSMKRNLALPAMACQIIDAEDLLC